VRIRSRFLAVVTATIALGSGAVAGIAMAPSASAVATSVIRLGDTTVVESPTTVVYARASLTLTSPLLTSECVWYHTVDGSAIGTNKFTVHNGTQDYLSTTAGRVTVPVSKVTAVISVLVNFGPVAQADKVFSIVIDKATAMTSGKCLPTTATDPTVEIARYTAEVTIIDGTSASPTILIGDTDTAESPTVLRPASSPVGLSAPLAYAECVWWHTVDGSAIGAKKFTVHDGTQDYRSTAGHLLIAAGRTTATITTTVNYDVAVEPNETYTVVIDKTSMTTAGKCPATTSQDPNVTIGRSAGSVLIRTDTSFAGQNLTSADLSNENLSGIDFTGATLTGANLAGANLTDATLTGVVSGGLTTTPTELPGDWRLVDGYLAGPGANLAGADLYVPGAGADFTSADLRGADLSGAQISNARFDDADLTGANLSNTLDYVYSTADYTGTRFVGANLAYANLSGARLYNPEIAVDFESADLTHADLSGAKFTGGDMDGTILVDANLSSADVSATSMVGSDMSGANLSSIQGGYNDGTWCECATDLVGAKFVGADLSNAYLEEVTLGDNDMRNAKLQGADFALAEVFDTVNLENDDLSGANFEYLYIQSGSLDMRHANLTGADFGSADLEDFVNLSFANLTNADFSYSNLTGTDLTTATITGVVWKTTTCPDGTISDNDGGTCVGHL
jgi:uncharacterized protein YjbI with pentapeptide repeats